MASKPNGLTSDTFKPLLKKLVTDPSSFDADDTRLAFEHLLRPGTCTETQIGGFLTAMHLSGMEERGDVLAAAAGVLKKWCRKPVVEKEADGGGEEEEVVADIVGTGGDGHDTFNVSTAAGIIAAGAGLRVCKVSFCFCFVFVCELKLCLSVISMEIELRLVRLDLRIF